jgi:hypothetical protein
MPSIAQLLPLLGKDYERKCIELGSIRRACEIKTPTDLMMLYLFHPDKHGLVAGRVNCISETGLFGRLPCDRGRCVRCG